VRSRGSGRHTSVARHEPGSPGWQGVPGRRERIEERMGRHRAEARRLADPARRAKRSLQQDLDGLERRRDLDARTRHRGGPPASGRPSSGHRRHAGGDQAGGAARAGPPECGAWNSRASLAVEQRPGGDGASGSTRHSRPNGHGCSNSMRHHYGARVRPAVAVRPEVPGRESQESMSEVVQYYLLSILEFVAIDRRCSSSSSPRCCCCDEEPRVKTGHAYRRTRTRRFAVCGFAIGRPLATAISDDRRAAVGPAHGAERTCSGLGWYAMLVPLVRLVRA